MSFCSLVWSVPLQSIITNASCPPFTSKCIYPAVWKAAAFCFTLTKSGASFTDKWSETQPIWVLAVQLPLPGRESGKKEKKYVFNKCSVSQAEKELVCLKKLPVA